MHDGEDLRRVLGPERGLTEWLYASDLQEGSCAVVHENGVGLELAFDPGRLPDDLDVGGVRRLARALRPAHRAVDEPARAVSRRASRPAPPR